MLCQLELLAELLQGRDNRALLIGGYALQAYGVVRQTIDVDFLVDEEGAAGFGGLLAREGYRETARTQTFIRFVHDSPAVMDVDLLLVDEATLDELTHGSIEYRHGSALFRVPSLPHLIAMKLHAAKNNPQRALREAGDIVALVKANPGALSMTQLRQQCERYGPPGMASLTEAYL